MSGLIVSFKQNKTIKNRKVHNSTRKKRSKNYMRETISSSSKKNNKYEPINTLPKMNFSVKSKNTLNSLQNDNSTRTLIKRSSQSSLSSPRLLSREYQWDDTISFSDELNHFTNDNFGSDPYNHFE